MGSIMFFYSASSPHLQLFLCIDSHRLLLALFVQLRLQIAEHLGHATPLLLAGFLLGLNVPLVLSLQGLHVDLQTHLLVLARLEFVLQLIHLLLHLVALSLENALGLLQLVDVLVGIALLKN